MMTRCAGASLLLAFALVGCRSRTKTNATPDAATPIDAAVAAVATPDAAPPAGSSSGGGKAGPPPRATIDSACKLLRGPYTPPFGAPVALRLLRQADVDVAEVIGNAGGAPRFFDALGVDAGVPIAAPAKSTLPACSAARDVVFCPDARGAIHRSHGAGEGDEVVAESRPGTRIKAAALGNHVVLAYLAERVTGDGLLREAFAKVDDAAPVRISEEGSGATFVDLAPRGDALLALLIDARVAMTPTHARQLTYEAGHLVVGTDAVVFVGGSAERHNAGALAVTKSGAAFGLVAVSDNASSFGMAAVRLDDPPRDTSEVTWSMYPNGLDPAPLAATLGEPSAHVARVRPKAADPGSPHVLEIGALDAAGAFASLCVIAEARFVRDVELAADRQGALWVYYRDPAGPRLERRALPR